MKAAAPALLPLLRSQAQGELLALLFLNPDDEYSLTDIARITGSSLTTVHAEATRLVNAGVVRDRRVGNTRLVKADTTTPLAAPLVALVMATYGPPTVLGDELASVPGIDFAYLHGQWADRHAGHEGPVPESLELLVVGTPSEDAVDSAVTRASQTLLRPIKVSQVTPGEWVEATDAEAPSGWLAEVAAGPLVPVVLTRRDRSRYPSTPAGMPPLQQDVPVVPPEPKQGDEPPPESPTDEAAAPSPEPKAPLLHPLCPLLARVPIIGERVPQWEPPQLSLPGIPEVVTRVAGGVIGVATLRWFPWDSLPIHVHVGPCHPGSDGN